MKNRLIKIRELALGSYDEMNRRYLRLFGRDCSDKVTERREYMLRLYVTVIAAAVLVLFVYTAGHIREMRAYGKDNGEVVSIKRDDAGRTYSLIVSAGGEKRQITFYISPVSEDGEYIEPRELKLQDNTDDNSGLDAALRKLVKSIEENPAKRTIVLPSSLENGTEITYSVKKDFTWVYILAGMILMLAVIQRSRYDSLEKQETEGRDSVLMELPQFLNKLTLMMGGGIVVTDAVDRIISEYIEMNDEENYFYTRMRDIRRVVIETNSSYEKQILKFAQDTGVHEFIRIANILADNVEKGAELVSKLEAESRYLWFSRKKKAEELGKMAETKLTFPLVILLISLILMTVSPAMIEM